MATPALFRSCCVFCHTHHQPRPQRCRNRQVAAAAAWRCRCRCAPQPPGCQDRPVVSSRRWRRPCGRRLRRDGGMRRGAAAVAVWRPAQRLPLLGQRCVLSALTAHRPEVCLRLQQRALLPRVWRQRFHMMASPKAFGGLALLPYLSGDAVAPACCRWNCSMKLPSPAKSLRLPAAARSASLSACSRTLPRNCSKLRACVVRFALARHDDCFVCMMLLQLPPQQHRL